MKSRTSIFATVIFIALTAACTLNGQNATGDNDPKPRSTPELQVAEVGDAKAEAAAPKGDGSKFKGSIGSAKVEMNIKREGGDLSGTYYYVRSGAGNRLTLKGKISADGSFTMQEMDAAGKTTGEFKGKWMDDPNESGASLEGEWLKPGQKSDGAGFYAWEQMIDLSAFELKTREIKETNKAKRAELSAEYPELTGGAKTAGFNQLAKANVTRALADFRKYLTSITAADVKEMGEMGNYIDIGYSVEFADDDLISVNFGEHTFTGGAHPNHGTTTLTYDLKLGREVKLADLFKQGSKYLTAIASYVTHDLQSRKDPESGENLGLAQDIFEDGAKPTVENYRNWNVTRKGLMFTFPPYQVASYASGPQTVIIPYSQLKDIARPDGALAKVKQ